VVNFCPFGENNLLFNIGWLWTLVYEDYNVSLAMRYQKASHEISEGLRGFGFSDRSRYLD